MIRGRTPLFVVVVLALFALSVLIAGCSKTGPTSSPQPDQGAAKTKLKDANQLGDPKAPVKIVAYYPFNVEHIPAAEYAASLADKFPGKVYVEVYNIESQDGREKWSSTGMECAGVVTNGKITWEVTRSGKKEQITFARRPPAWWSQADLEAVIASQIKDPKAVPEVPAAAAKPAAEGEAPTAEPTAKADGPAGKADAKPAAEDQ